jgi:DNA polymerase-3 subunit beta
VFISKLINGSYPDTSKLIPTTFEVTMKVNHNEFFGTIDRASLLTNEADKNTIKLDNKGNEITISSNIPEIGNVEEKMIVSKDNDQDIRIAFSSKYMLDALKAFDCEDVELLFNGEVSPIIVKNPNTDNLIQLILPIRTY